jgi:hypothetical protein
MDVMLNIAIFQWLERFTDPEHDARHGQPSRNSCSLWSIQLWPTAAGTLTGSHELMPKDHPMTLILTKYQVQINPTIHHIVIWYNCEDCRERTICFEFILPHLADETTTQPQFARTSSMPIWPSIHNFLIVSLVELSLGQFCTILKQYFTAWNGEQNHHWRPTGLTPTYKDQNIFFDKRCDALRICAWWINSEFYVKTESDFKSGISVLREMLLVHFARQCSYSCCHDNETLNWWTAVWWRSATNLLHLTSCQTILFLVFHKWKLRWNGRLHLTFWHQSFTFKF